MKNIELQSLKIANYLNRCFKIIVMEIRKPQLKKISETEWEIPQNFKRGMRVPAKIIGTKRIVDEMDLQVYDQITNVATLPGIVKYAFCMPDGHIFFSKS